MANYFNFYGLLEDIAVFCQSQTSFVSWGKCHTAGQLWVHTFILLAATFHPGPHKFLIRAAEVGGTSH